MIIKRVLNNNVVVVLDELDNEQVIFGKGIGFQKVSGDRIDHEAINKVFVVPDTPISNDLQKLLNDIPFEYLEIAQEIVSYANIHLNKKLNPSLAISISDHISSAVTRFEKRQSIKNAMLNEIRNFYSSEYSVGIYALDMIREKIGVSLNEDEAAFIAMHIVNASLDNSEISGTYKITKLIQEVSNLVSHYFSVEFNVESIFYYRFITHLKFFAQRLIQNDISTDGDEELFNTIVNKYSNSYNCVRTIDMYLKSNYNFVMSQSEIMYLTIHIEKIINNSKEGYIEEL